MKDFFKLMLHGLLIIGMSMICLALLIFPIVTLVMEIPTVTGFKAIGLFIMSMFQFGCGCLLTCILGCFSVKMADS